MCSYFRQRLLRFCCNPTFSGLPLSSSWHGRDSTHRSLYDKLHQRTDSMPHTWLLPPPPACHTVKTLERTNAYRICMWISRDCPHHRKKCHCRGHQEVFCASPVVREERAERAERGAATGEGGCLAKTRAFRPFPIDLMEASRVAERVPALLLYESTKTNKTITPAMRPLFREIVPTDFLKTKYS